MVNRRVQVEAVVVARFCLCVSDAHTHIHTHRQIERESEAGDLRRSCETTLIVVAVTGMFLWNYLNVRGNYWNVHWNYLNVLGDCRDVPGN